MQFFIRCRNTAEVVKACTVLVLLFAIASTASAEEKKSIYYVEECWELILNEPEPANNSPQVSFFVFPDEENEESYFELQMNYAADEHYSSGGFRVTAVQDGNPVHYQRGGTHQKWSVDQDRISWKTVLAHSKGKYYFAIKEGHSSDWGDFGGPAFLVEMTDSAGVELQRYHPKTSLANVDVGFGANRIASIKMTDVRVVFTDGSETTIPLQTTPTSVALMD